jgi:hypothetical protein
MDSSPIGDSIHSTRTLTGTHRENEAKVEQELLEENNISRTARTECISERGKRNEVQEVLGRTNLHTFPK